MRKTLRRRRCAGGGPDRMRRRRAREGTGRRRWRRPGVTSPASKDGADSTVSRWLVDVWSGGPRGAMYRDRAPEEYRKIFSITRR